MSRENSPGMGQERSLEQELLGETKKWLERGEELFCRISGDEQILENVFAYISDSHYFLEKGDLIRAFESVVWAWAWMEIGLEKKLLQQND
jgi:uncharacterized protein